MTETQIKRTRETNPIYQGGYTIEDYLQEIEAEPKYLTVTAANFKERFKVLPHEEKVHLIRIDEQAKDRYKGATEWDVGKLSDIEGYDCKNIDPLDYYQTFYELEDEDAILKRLDQLNEMAAYMELWNTRYLELRSKAGDWSDLDGAIKRWATQYRQLSLNKIVISQEKDEALMEAGRLGLHKDYADLIDELIRAIEIETEKIKGVINLGKTLEDLKQTEYAQIVETVEAGLTEDVFNQDFEPFREAYGKGLDDARLRIVRHIIYYVRRVGTYEDDLSLTAENILGYEILNQWSISNHSEDGAVANEQLADTLTVAKEHPLPLRKSHVVTTGHLNREIAMRNPDPRWIRQEIDGDLVKVEYDAPQNEKMNISGTLLLKGPLTARHQTIISTISSLYYDNKRKDPLSDPLDLPETKLIAECYTIDERNVTEEYRIQFYQDMFLLNGSRLNANWSKYLSTNGIARKEFEKEYPDNLDYIVDQPLVSFRRYPTIDRRGNRSYRYKIDHSPIMDFMDINTGMVSILEITIKETPIIPWSSIPDVVKESMEELSNHNRPSIQLFKGEESGRYIPGLIGIETSQYMDKILQSLEYNKRLDKTMNRGYFDMDLNRILESVWNNSAKTSQKTILKRKTAMLSYLYRLWIKDLETPEKTPKKPTPRIHGLTVLTEGKNWHTIRIYVSETEKKIPAIEKIEK